MTIAPLVLEGAKRNPLRYGLTIVSLAFGFVLFGLLHNISAGFDYTLAWLAGDSLRVTSKVSLRQPLPLSHLRKIEQIPDVTQVQYAALFGAFYKEPKNVISGAAVSPAKLLAFPHLRIREDQAAAFERARTGAVVGEVLATRYGWRVGDKLPLTSPSVHNKETGPAWTFDIVGIWTMEGNPDLANEVYVNYEYMNEGRAEGRDTVNIFTARVASTDAARRAAQAIDATFANSPAETLTRTDREWVGAVIRQVGDVRLMVNLVLGTALFTLFVLVRNSISQSVRERRAEFGVMKVLGFTDMEIAAVIMLEVLLLCLIAAAVGLGIAAYVYPAFARVVKLNLSFTIPAVIYTGLGVSALLAVAAGLPSAISLMRLQPAQAVRQE
jgi:putative ABC transport system permease protein